VNPAGAGASGPGQPSGGLERLAGGLTHPALAHPSAGLDSPPPGAASGALARPSAEAFQPGGRPGQPGIQSRRGFGAGLRLTRLYLTSRRVLTCLLILVGCAVVLRVALHWLPRTGVLSRQIPLTIEAAAAAAIGVTARSPFGDPERVGGRWLPFLRLVGIVVAAAAAVGALAAGAASAHLAGGTIGLLRDLGGFAGLGLLVAVAAGGGLAWTGPMAYLVVAISGIEGGWTTPWVWPARPPHDRGAAICAAAVFAAGVALLSLRGSRDSSRD
jgi:hypothetical protein